MEFSDLLLPKETNVNIKFDDSTDHVNFIFDMLKLQTRIYWSSKSKNYYWENEKSKMKIAQSQAAIAIMNDFKRKTYILFSACERA